MTYKAEPSHESSKALRSLVVLFITWVAYWASTGGLERMLTEEPTTSVLRTLI